MGLIKPTFLLVFFIGMAGYHYLENLHTKHYQLKRSSGNHTFFLISAYGLVFFGVAVLLYGLFLLAGKALGIESSFGHLILCWVFSLEEDNSNAAAIDVALIAVCLSISTKYYHYGPNIKEFFSGNGYSFKSVCLYRQETFKKQASEFKNAFLNDPESPEFTRTIRDSLQTRLPILFTMSDNKVYVGYIYEVTPRPRVSDILLLPILSGYRNDKTQKFLPTTPYEKVLSMVKDKRKQAFVDSLEKDGVKVSEESMNSFLEQHDELFKKESWAQFVVTLPIREIVHAHLYDATLQGEFDKLSPSLQE